MSGIEKISSSNQDDKLRLPIADNRAFSLTLDQYKSLKEEHPEEFARLSKLAGKTPEAFMGMMEQAAQSSDEDSRARKERDRELEAARGTYQKIPDKIRVALKLWKPTDEELKQAKLDEQEANELLGGQASTEEIKEPLFRGVLVEMRAEFVEICKDQSLAEAFRILLRNNNERIRRTNLPELREAITNAQDKIGRWIRNQERNYKNERRNRASEPGPTGPAEVFEINTQKRNPTSGRSPHRLNDEHEGW